MTLHHAFSHGAFTVENHCLQIAGQPITRIGAMFAGQPFYLYSRQHLVERVQSLKAQLPSGVDLHYAIKANPMPAVVELLAQHCHGLDVASGQEMFTALATGTSPELISFAGPGKSVQEIRAAIAAGIVLNVESANQWQVAIDQGKNLGIKPRIAVRVNPAFELKSSGMQMTGGAKPFGMDAEIIGDYLQHFGTQAMDFYGFHIFSGSQNLKAEAIIEAQQKSLTLALELAQFAPCEPRFFNLGGGFGVPYFAGEKPLDTGPIMTNLRQCVTRLRQHYQHTRLVIELGRYLVAEAGLYICQIIEQKKSRDQRFIVTNGGLHHHLAASGNFGQVIRKNYPVVAANRLNQPITQKASVVGPLCTPLDILASKIDLPDLQTGDLIAVYQSGAYGYSASPHQFLSHPLPQQLLL